MKRRARERTLHAVGILLCVLLACGSAFALDPNLDVSQYAHTAWKVRDGFVKGEIQSIAQTPDGYLWLGTESGLVLFDGVRIVPWIPPSGGQLPSTNIWSLLAIRSLYKKSPPQRELVDVNEIIAELLTLLRCEARSILSCDTR